MKTAFIFPGQGSQYVGMAQDFYQQIPKSKEVFDIASEILKLNMTDLCFVENDNINKTEYTQAALLTSCISILKAVEIEGLKADITAGLSLGEYSALVSNGVFSFEDAVKLVRKRGMFMEYEVPDGLGTMAAILGSDSETVERICREVSLELSKPVEPANYNCPGQIVISGEKSAVLEANKRLTDAGAKRAIELKVSGPFHSSMLSGVEEKLQKELEPICLNDMQIPYINNVNADIMNQTDEIQIKELLKKQVSSPVKWEQSVNRMIDLGVDTFIEIGPGKTLSGFIKKIDRTKQVINIEKIEDLQKIKTATI